MVDTQQHNMQEKKLNAGNVWQNNSIGVLALLAFTVWLAHFFHSGQFGLYEDDYAVISIGESLSDLWVYTKELFTDWPEGRPIGYFALSLLSYVAGSAGGLHAMYILGFLIVTLNAFLYYHLLRRVTTETISVIAALALCLFPADTTHSFLTHLFQLQTSITFLLIACNLYLSGRRITPYLVISASILTYESPFFIFLAMPLLKFRWSRELAQESLRHVGLVGLILLVAVVVRLLTAEDRLGSMGEMGAQLWQIPWIIVKSMVIGPGVSLNMFFYGPYLALMKWANEYYYVFFSCLAVFSLVLVRLFSMEGRISVGPREVIADTVNRVTLQDQGNNGDTRRIEMWQLYLAAVVMMCLGYVVSFTHYPPVTWHGRFTSVHLAAAIGGALIFSCIADFIIATSVRINFRFAGTIVLAAWLSILVVYRYGIQQEFIDAWNNQKTFWRTTIKTIPDMKDGTVIFFNPNGGLPQTRYIQSNSWADPILLRKIFHFPEAWKNPPRLFVVRNTRKLGFTRVGNDVLWDVPEATWYAHQEILPDGNLILLKMVDGRVVRTGGTVSVSGKRISLLPKPKDLNLRFEKGPLYRYLIEN